MDGKVNRCESLLNVVNGNKPKRLNEESVGLSQKAQGQAQRLPNSLSQMKHPRRTGAILRLRSGQALNHSRLHPGNVVSPYRSHRESEPQGKPMAVRVEEVGKSEGWSVMDQIGVEPQATSPHAKAGTRSVRQVFRHEII